VYNFSLTLSRRWCDRRSFGEINFTYSRVRNASLFFPIKLMPHARRAPLPAPRLRQESSNHGKSPGVFVRVGVTKPLHAGRQAFRLGSGGYRNFLKRRTLPNDDTGIVAVTVRRDIYFLANAPCAFFQRASKHFSPCLLGHLNSTDFTFAKGKACFPIASIPPTDPEPLM
jgi:hypothetical protein